METSSTGMYEFDGGSRYESEAAVVHVANDATETEVDERDVGWERGIS